MNYKNKILFLLSFVGMVSMSQFAHSQSDLIGKKAPAFTAQIVDPNGNVHDFDLKNYVGKLIVLYFYPMDNTPGCTKQAKKFRDDIKKLESKGITVIGISHDSINSHKKFQKKHDLPFSLISGKKSISKLYGAAGFLLCNRKTFLINEKGVVVKSFDKVDIQNQIQDILKAFNK